MEQVAMRSELKQVDAKIAKLTHALQENFLELGVGTWVWIVNACSQKQHLKS